jgi:hypothetical protein
MSEKVLSRNRTYYGTYTNGKPAVQAHQNKSVKEIRIKNFREMLRKLVRKNDKIFGKS